MSKALEHALARLFRERRRPPAGELIENLSPAAFRATVDLRLGNLERQLDELKGRINGLLFLLAGAVATQVVLKLLA
jgi:hypothetical protein